MWGPPCQWDKGRMHLVHTKLFPLLEGEIDGPITLKSFEKAKYRHQIHAKGQSCCYFAGEAPPKGVSLGFNLPAKGRVSPMLLASWSGRMRQFSDKVFTLKAFGSDCNLDWNLEGPFLRLWGEGKGWRIWRWQKILTFYYFIAESNQDIAYALNIYPMEWTRCFLFHKLFLWQILDILYFDYKCLRLFSKKKKNINAWDQVSINLHLGLDFRGMLTHVLNISWESK